MLPTNRTHKEYQNFVKSQIQLHYTSGILKTTSNDWILVEKLWITDLSGTATFLEKQYGRRGTHLILKSTKNDENVSRQKERRKGGKSPTTSP